MKSLRWETSLTWKVTAADNVRFDDAFSLYKIEQKNIRNFVTVASLLPFLDDFANVLEGNDVTKVDQIEFLVNLALLFTSGGFWTQQLTSLSIFAGSAGGVAEIFAEPHIWRNGQGQE